MIKTTRDSICNSVYEHKQIVYKKGEIIEVEDFDGNLNEVYATGIHYYKTMEVAFYLELKTDRDGEWRCWYENGQMQSKGIYKEGKEEGEWEYRYSNGQLESKGKYKEGKEEGEWEYWYSNGQLESKGKYKNGNREGEWIYLRKIGIIASKVIYKNGFFIEYTKKDVTYN